MFGQRADVFHQVVHLVVIHTRGFSGEIVAAHVRRDGAMIFGELRQLVLPLVPEFRETMQEHNQRPFPSGDVVETNSIHFGIFVFQCWAFPQPVRSRRPEPSTSAAATGHIQTLTKKTPETAEKKCGFWSNPKKEVGSDSLSMRHGGFGGCPHRLVSRMRSVAESIASANGRS